MASKEELQKLIDSYNNLNRINSSFRTIQQQIAILQEEYIDRQSIINELTKNLATLSEHQKENLQKLNDDQKDNLKLLEKKTKLLEIHNASYRRQRSITNTINRTLKSMFNFINQSDKIIRQTNLELGLSGVRAEMMRTSFENSAREVYHMGGTLQDIKSTMTGIADETGRVAILSSQSVLAVEAIGRGTGLGVEQAARLAGQFQYMGLNAENTMNYVQGIVDTTERMGINTIKVLKNVNDNFRKLNTFTFQNGTKSIADMAINAEKTRVSMESALDIADSTRKLENVIELGANLQIMGGNFAKMDPLHWLYTVRNEPDKIIDKISKMTRGITQLKTMSDGTFETFITPADRDRLSFVAKQLNMTSEELKIISDRRFALDRVGNQLRGLNLSEDLTEYISNAAELNKQTGRYQINIHDNMTDIRDLNESQANVLKAEQKRLKERAIEAQSFDEAFKNTILEFKSILLPLLKGVNVVLEKIRPIVSSFAEWIDKLTKENISNGLWKAGGLMLTAAVMLKGVLPAIGRYVGNFARGLGSGTGGGWVGKTTRRGRSRGIRGSAKGGLGAGAAGLGIGAGIGLAAMGISTLAEAMDGLDVEKAEVLKDIVKTLGWIMISGLAVAGAIILIGGSSTAVAPGLLAFGAAALMVGAGIGVASVGIGFMAKNFSLLFESFKGNDTNLLGVATGIGAITASLVAATFALPQALGLSMIINKIGKNANNFDKIGNAFREISAVLSGSKDDFIAVERMLTSIGNIDMKKNNIISELANLLKKPLKVQFEDQKIALVSDITLNIDGEKFMRKVYRPQTAISKEVNIRFGKSSS